MRGEVHSVTHLHGLHVELPHLEDCDRHHPLRPILELAWAVLYRTIPIAVDCLFGEGLPARQLAPLHMLVLGAWPTHVVACR